MFLVKEYIFIIMICLEQKSYGGGGSGDEAAARYTYCAR